MRRWHASAQAVLLRRALLPILIAGCSSHGGQHTGDAGSAGLGEEPPPIIGTCDDLPDSDWQDITPAGHSTKPAVNGTVAAAVVVDPFDARSVWLGTGGENDEI